MRTRLRDIALTAFFTSLFWGYVYFFHIRG